MSEVVDRNLTNVDETFFPSFCSFSPSSFLICISSLNQSNERESKSVWIGIRLRRERGRNRGDKNRRRRVGFFELNKRTFAGRESSSRNNTYTLTLFFLSRSHSCTGSCFCGPCQAGFELSLSLSLLLNSLRCLAPSPLFLSFFFLSFFHFFALRPLGKKQKKKWKERMNKSKAKGASTRRRGWEAEDCTCPFIEYRRMLRERVLSCKSMLLLVNLPSWRMRERERESMRERERGKPTTIDIFSLSRFEWPRSK